MGSSLQPLISGGAQNIAVAVAHVLPERATCGVCMCLWAHYDAAHPHLRMPYSSSANPSPFPSLRQVCTHQQAGM